MKIETNFVRSAQSLALGLWIANAFLTLVLVGAGLLLWVDGDARREETIGAHARLKQLEARRAELGPMPSLPSPTELAALRERVSIVNSLSVTGGRRVVPLLVLFEELLPAEAWLVRFSHKAREGEIVLIAESDRAEHLTQFLLNLERSSRFAEVLLVRQLPVGSEGRRSIQFELKLKERV